MFPPRFVHGRFTQFVAISLRRSQEERTLTRLFSERPLSRPQEFLRSRRSRLKLLVCAAATVTSPFRQVCETRRVRNEKCQARLSRIRSHPIRSVCGSYRRHSRLPNVPYRASGREMNQPFNALVMMALTSRHTRTARMRWGRVAFLKALRIGTGRCDLVDSASVLVSPKNFAI